MNKLKVIDLFAGVGGLSYGFSHNENFEVIASNEIVESAAESYVANHPSAKMYNTDIKYFNSKLIETDFGIKEVDIIVGGPPCQAYSTIGKRVIDDPRGNLFQEYYRILKELNPKLFLFENVKGLLSMGCEEIHKKGELFNIIKSLFENLGYKISYKILNSADYGVPQLRERVFIVGTKIGNEFVFPEPTTNEYITVEDAISDLPFKVPFLNDKKSISKYQCDPKNEYQKLMRKDIQNEEIKYHDCPKNHNNLNKLMKLLPDGGSPDDLDLEKLDKDVFEWFNKITRYKNTYCKLWWNKPSITITRNFGTPSSSRCIHPLASRPLTTREGARIQSFPDNYVFCGSKGSKNLQIGNAVPPLLSKILAEHIAEHFND